MIFKSDRERDGYLEGLRQARAGKRKDHRTIGLMKAAMQPFDGSFKSYMEGLNRGYTDGLREIHTHQKVIDTPPPAASKSPSKPAQSTSHSRSSNQSTMTDSIGAQIEALEDLKNFLSGFAQTLNDASEEYQRYVTAVGDQGMVERVVQRYEDEFMTPNLNQIRALVSRIEGEDTPYIGREISHLEQAGHQ